MLQALIPVIGSVAEKLVSYIPDPAERARAQAEAEKALLEAAMATQAGQVEINKIEAASDNLFKSGWRPGLGWVLVAAFAYQYLGRPLLAAFGKPAPSLDGGLMELTAAMLGLGGLRTWEKIRGVTRS